VPRLQLIGRTLPQVVNVNSNAISQIAWASPNSGLKAVFYIQIRNSIVYLNIDVNRFNPSELGEIVNRGYDFVRASLDLICFATGRGLGFAMETMIDPDANLSSLVIEDRALPPLCTSFSLDNNNSYMEVLRLVAGVLWSDGTGTFGRTQIAKVPVPSAH
jgi:hypothetical protein